MNTSGAQPWQQAAQEKKPATNTPAPIGDGGPAFPQHGWTSDPATLARMQASGIGLSIRDYFAAKAMAAEITDQGLEGRETDHIAGMAYEMADAMLVARKAVAP